MSDTKETKEDAQVILNELQAKFTRADDELTASRRAHYEKLQAAYDALQQFTANRDRYYVQIINLQKNKIVALEAENASLRAAKPVADKRPDNIEAPK